MNKQENVSNKYEQIDKGAFIEFLLSSFRGLVIGAGVFSTVLLSVFGAALQYSSDTALVFLRAFGYSCGAFLALSFCLAIALDGHTTSPDIPFRTQLGIICALIGGGLFLWTIYLLLSRVPATLS